MALKIERGAVLIALRLKTSYPFLSFVYVLSSFYTIYLSLSISYTIPHKRVGAVVY